MCGDGRGTVRVVNPWAGRLVAEALDDAATKWPDRFAVVDGNVRVTFAELRTQRNDMAAGLTDFGVGNGTPVAVYMTDSWEHAVLIHALLYLGATVVPINLAWESREILFALQQSQSEVLIAGTEYKRRDLHANLASLGLVGSGPVDCPRAPRLHTVIVHARGKRAPGVTLDHVLRRGKRLKPPPPTQHSGGYLFYRQSRWSFPRGAEFRQDTALGIAHFVADSLQLCEDDRFLNLMPFYHPGGIIYYLLACLQSGATLYVFPGFDEELMLATMGREKCTVTAGIDGQVRRIVRGFQTGDQTLPLRKVMVAPGIEMRDYLAEVGVEHTVTCYSTDIGDLVAITGATPDSGQGRFSHGKPLPGVDLRICDPKTSEAVPVGSPGEIRFKGWTLFGGFHRMKPAYEACLDADGYFCTGDYGWVDEAGNVYYRGRYSQYIQTGGEAVSESEVERFLVSEVDGVVRAAVIGVPNDQWGESVVGFVELEDPDIFDEDQLRNACRGRLARYKVPKHFLLQQAHDWPLNANGEIDKDELRRRAPALF
jgi:fatty-acyl-CoA synthase